MNRIIRPFGPYGRPYRTDDVGKACYYAAYLPALFVILLVAMGFHPVLTLQSAATTLAASLGFIAILFAIILRRSERIG